MVPTSLNTLLYIQSNRKSSDWCSKYNRTAMTWATRKMVSMRSAAQHRPTPNRQVSAPVHAKQRLDILTRGNSLQRIQFKNLECITSYYHVMSSQDTVEVSSGSSLFIAWKQSSSGLTRELQMHPNSTNMLHDQIFKICLTFHDLS